jgi:CheY-like chemotaxis protein
MKVLVIEDDENKRNQILRFINERFPLATLTAAESFQSGLKLIITEQFDLVLLDMTLPTFDPGIDEDGGRPRAYAGREILRQMDRRRIETPVVVVTQFDRFGEGADALTLQELDARLRQAHPRTYHGAIYYSSSIEGWNEELARKMSRFERLTHG